MCNIGWYAHMGDTGKGRGKTMKKRSFIRRTVVLLVIQLVLLISMLLAYIFISYRNTVEGMQQSAENFMQLYGKELDNKIENADRILEQLIYDNPDYALIQSAGEAERYYASVNLFQRIREMVVSNSNIDFIVVAESEYQNCLLAENVVVTAGEREAVRQFALECAAQGRTKAQWNVRMLGEKPYIYKAHVWQNRMAGVFISVDSLMETAAGSDFGTMALYLVDAGQSIWGAYGDESLVWEQGDTLPEETRHQLKSEYSLADGQLVLYSYTNMGDFAEQIAGSRLVILGMILISLFSGILLVADIRNEILRPMGDMRENMEQIENGDYEHRIEQDYGSLEFELLKNSFNKLMDEIVGLKIRSYEKQIELQESELRSIRLQIRPHFFLNAMTTISSLSMQGKGEEIKKYIDALSKNIRYMFKSGLHTVPLGEEVRHVENYFEMQELKYPGSVFYYISMEPECEDWMIPQMVIHTIIENEYKYAVSVDGLLSILIKIGKVHRNGEEMLCIEIEDDGGGYPVEVLARFGEEDSRPFSDGSRVGLWSIRKMLELMYEKKGLFEISNVTPHGCLNRLYIPKQPVCEVGRELIQNMME